MKGPVRALLALAAFGLAPAVALAQPATAPSAIGHPAPGTYMIHAIDVGTGLSLFVEGADFTLLYDAGSNDDGALGGGDRVLAYLHKVRPDLTTIDHLILSHPHEDHDAMIEDVLKAYAVRNVWDSGAVNDTCAYRAFLDAVIAEAGVVYHDALASGGHRDQAMKARSCRQARRPAATLHVPQGPRIDATPVPLGSGAQMTFLWADGVSHPNLNENSVVVRLDLGGRRILFPGDAQGGDRKPPSTPPNPRYIEGKLLACCAAGLKADVLIAGHHGSMTSSRTAFLDAVGAHQFIVSTGPQPYSGTRLPDKVVMDELASRGTVWRTDLNDATCGANAAKIGPDADGKAGGCDNVLVVIPASGPTAIAYYRAAD